MGDLLSKRFTFTALRGIREAYGVVFGRDAHTPALELIYTALSDQSLNALSAVRNVIVHKAGQADAEYRKKCEDAPLAPKAELNTTIPLDAGVVLELVRPAMLAGAKLVEAVNHWLTAEGRRTNG